MNIRGLSTPAVIVDLDIVERNLQRMADYCREHGIGLRPHTKTHKSILMARRQLALGAVGLTVAKVGEAEIMAAADACQILVAHPIVGDEKLRRLASLAKTTEILVAVDSVKVAEGVSRIAVETGSEIGILIEFDSGSHRCGVAPGACAEPGEAIAHMPGVRLRGLMTYFGSVWGSKELRLRQMADTASAVSLAISTFRKRGLSTEIVSAGSTPAAEISHLVPGITEIRPGTYIYNDRNTFAQGACELKDCALRVMTTVVSTSVPGQVIIDAGSKTLSSDRLGAGDGEGFGLIEGRGSSIAKLNEEHGFLQTSNTNSFAVGDVLEVVPNHVCTCVNMHDELFLHRGGEVEGVLQIDARGRVC